MTIERIQDNHQVLSMRKALHAFDGPEWRALAKRSVSMIEGLLNDYEMDFNGENCWTVSVGMGYISVNCMVMRSFNPIPYDDMLELANMGWENSIDNDFQLNIYVEDTHRISLGNGQHLGLRVALELYCQVPDEDIATLRALGKIQEHYTPGHTSTYISCEV